MPAIRKLTVKLLDREVMLLGRLAWALDRLISGGKEGCSVLDHPAPRWSHYVFMMRQMGIEITTVREKHGGPYPGVHARYILQSPLSVLSSVTF